MKTNEGIADRLVRIVLALALLGLTFATPMGESTAWVLWSLSAILVLTALWGFCPLYAVFGINTCPVKPKQSAHK